MLIPINCIEFNSRNLGCLR